MRKVEIEVCHINHQKTQKPPTLITKMKMLKCAPRGVGRSALRARRKGVMSEKLHVYCVRRRLRLEILGSGSA